MKRNRGIYIIRSNELLQAQSEEYRQYFVGCLKRPQALPHLEENNLEIGSSLYSVPRADIPHFHKRSSESIYLISGTYRILLIDTKEEFELREGDFLVIPPLTSYASKAVQRNTRTLFIKTGGNDKVIVNIDKDKEVQTWLNDL